MGRALAGLACLLVAGCAQPDGGGPDQGQAPTSGRGLSYPEGPFAFAGAMLIAQMGADAVTVRAAGEGIDRPFWHDPGCGPTALAPYDGGLVVLCHLTGDLVRVSMDGRSLGRLGRTAGLALRNPNDGAADGRGGVYFSDPGPFMRALQPQGRVVWLDSVGRLRAVADGLAYPNGVFITQDAQGARYAYVSEHFARRILRYPIADDGSFGPATAWARIPPLGQTRFPLYDQAGPDGLEQGPDGDWYVAIYGEGRVLRLSPDGVLRGALETPFQFVTNVAFQPDGRVLIVGAFVPDAPPFPGGWVAASPSDFR